MFVTLFIHLDFLLSPFEFLPATTTRGTHMTYGQDQKGPAPGALRHHGEEAGIGRAAVGVVDAAGDRHAAVAALPGGRLPEHVAEL